MAGRGLLAAPAAAVSLLAGGGGGFAGGARVAFSTSAATTTTETGPAATQDGALAFARCRRSHGATNWADLATDIPSSIDQDPSRFRSAAAVCRKLIPAGLPSSSNTVRTGSAS